MTNTVAIIPARGGSKGLPEKNMREVAGKPLVSIAVQDASRAELVDKVTVTSDSEEILRVAESYGADTLGRPEGLATDTARVDPLLCWCVEQIEQDGEQIDNIVLLYPTTPLRLPEDVDSAVREIKKEPYDSVLSLYEGQKYVWEERGQSVVAKNYDPTDRKPRQREDWNQLIENKAVYVVKRDYLLETGCRLGENVGYIEMPPHRSTDIDDEFDLKLCRFLAKEYDLPL